MIEVYAGLWYNVGEMKVCVVLPTSNHLHRQMLEGIVDSAREKGPWQLFLVTEDDSGIGLKQARHWGATGVIGIGRKDAWTREILKWKVPTVLFNCMLRTQPPQTVYLMRDQEGIGKTAADYFLERGYKSFAAIGTAVANEWSERRIDGFAKRLRKARCTARVYASPTADESDDFGREAPRMREFLKSLPSGTAIFVTHDRRAQRVLGLCLELGITVPEQVAVLGVDDDRVICEAMTPPLSSISLDGVNSGRLAAQILSELMAGKTVDPVLKLDFPRVVTRQSTDTTVIEDTVLARTLAKVTADLSRPVKLNEIAEALGYSPRTLELKARKVFGCTLKEKINRLRLNEAVRLLSNSTLPVQKVAERCGFCGASHLGTRMKQAFGYPPSVFRH